VTVSIKRISAGDGYRYLMQTVTVGDGARPSSTPMTRYYTEAGTPPGRWMGVGLDGLGRSLALQPGSLVTEKQLFHLIGMGANPVTGEPLGAAPQRATPSNRERVHARLSALPTGLHAGEREARLEEIRRDELARESATTRKAVTGFDLTFSVPKSVSTVWAIGDAATQQMIVEAHHAAIGEALAWAEKQVFATRVGKAGAERVPVRGVIAAAFDHYDSRANDPHLHTHVVVANRVQTEPGGKWRTLDSRSLFRATVALSELHQGLLMDRITLALGVRWDGRTRRHSPVVQWEITGVPDELRAEFSQRASAIDKAKDELVAAYRTSHGRSPTMATVLKLRQQATLGTRGDKQLHSLADLMSVWRRRAAAHVGTDTDSWVKRLPKRAARPLRANDFSWEQVSQLAAQALAAVADKRATFTRWNVYAEAQRQLQQIRFADAADRQLLGDRVTDSALQLSLLLTAPEPPTEPAGLLRHVRTERFTTRHILDAEARLLDLGRQKAGPSLDDTKLVFGVRGRSHLSPEQEAVLADIATSGRPLDLLVGAAGTGKTAAMGGLATVWQQQYGPGSVIGLAPSAAAADVLAGELGLAAENTAKWTTEIALESKRLTRIDELRQVLNRMPIGSPQVGRIEVAIDDLATEIDRWRIKPEQLVIVDEASLVGTLTLDRIVAQACEAGAKVLLVGDPAQLSAVEAGGAFAMLVRDRGEVPELVDIRRFNESWEKQASLALRAGDPTAVEAYNHHGRIHDGDRDEMLDQAYAAWLTDKECGKLSLLIAADANTVIDLNSRARADLVAIGQVAKDGVQLADGTVTGKGDRIVTRRNDRTITTGRTWVKNGDQWTVVGVDQGALIVQRRPGAKKLTLPAAYVREHVELGYATTAHRAQGQTVDTAHAIVTGPGMTREALYVAATRAREANHLYVRIGDSLDVESSRDASEYPAAGDVLLAVLNNRGADLSAHETMQAQAGLNTVAPQNFTRREWLVRPVADETTLPAPHVAHERIR
jgi:conjugative relaxase-like TrwC/TraI family protein